MPDVHLESYIGKTFARDGERWKLYHSTSDAEACIMWCVAESKLFEVPRSVVKAWLAGATEVKSAK